MKLHKRHFIYSIIGAAMSAAPMIGFSSCDGAIYEDLDACPKGVELRFIYDYNMEFANAFHNRVDCLTLLIFDKNGKYLGKRTETTAALADENYRMTIDLDEGDYHFVAYGGMECGERSFGFTQDVASLTDVNVALDPKCLTDPDRKDLHDLYFGDLDMTVTGKELSYDKGTVEMMRDTNTLRILLQHLDGTPVDPADFDFSITDDNTLFAHNNDVIPTSPVTYTPWSSGQVSAGMSTNGEVLLAYAEMTTSRFVTSNSPKLIVKKTEGGTDVINIPLINYLLLYKSERYGSSESKANSGHPAMGDQEFLDRENRWNMIFFLDNGNRWVQTKIVVNDWTVRIDNIKL